MTERSTGEAVAIGADSALSTSGDAALYLYLDRCQVDTPDHLVELVWKLVRRHRRAQLKKVVDFGAGDGRFAGHGHYETYIGYEIDPARMRNARLPAGAQLQNACAFAEEISNASLSIGNPPFVRNQDLPVGWRERACGLILQRTGVQISGLANAWQYFFFLSLASTAANGLVALVIPYEWVSRPSVRALRQYIKDQRWNVDVYKLRDEVFDRVLTTASIAVIDKRARQRRWRYFEQTDGHRFAQIPSATGRSRGPLPYKRAAVDAPAAKRGLSPGTQKVFTLTEAERVRLGLRVGRDVVRCVTTLRKLPADIVRLDEAAFTAQYVNTDLRCWLVRTDHTPSDTLMAYFESVCAVERDTATCRNRSVWWKFTMPKPADLLVSTGFRTKPKVVRNVVGAIAVGGVTGVYGVAKSRQAALVTRLRSLSYVNEVVAHANGLRKLEVNQLNALLERIGIP